MAERASRLKCGWRRGAGEAADVGEGFDFFGGEQGEEIVQLAVGVADGPDGWHCDWGIRSVEVGNGEL